MFDYDKWQEIWSTVKKNKLRTFLTMFGVFWGIFMLMILLGSGIGLENGVTRGFSGWATNSGFVWSERTGMAYKGFKPGRYFNFHTDDYIAIKEGVKGLEYLAPRNQLGGWSGGNNVSRNKKIGAFSVYGDYPDYQNVQILNVVKGRHLNPLDIKERRKVAVIGESVLNILFEKDEDPLNQYIKINGVYFKVIGVFKSFRTGQQADFDTQNIYVPFTTFQQSFNFGNRIGWFGFTAKEGYSVAAVTEDIISILKKRHNVHPDDKNALGSENLEVEFGQIYGLFSGIKIFVWIVGIGTLIAGVIGVSNIMLIIVKERTKEIGIRKSLGATPGSIVSLVLQESIIITALAGYLGLFFGMLLLEGISYALSQAEDPGMFHNPSIDLTIAASALAVLIVFGALAGLIPARKAASVSPIEAIRIE